MSLDGALRYENVAAVFKTPKGCIDILAVAQQSKPNKEGYCPPRRHSVCDRYLAASHLTDGVTTLPSPGIGDVKPRCVLRNVLLENVAVNCPLRTGPTELLRVWLLELADEGRLFEDVSKGGSHFQDPQLLRTCMAVHDTVMLQRAFSAKIDVVMVYLRDNQFPDAAPLLLSSLFTGARYRVPKWPETMPDTRPPDDKKAKKAKKARPPVTAIRKKKNKLDYGPVQLHFYRSVTAAVSRDCNEVRRTGGSAGTAVLNPDTMSFLRQQRGALPRSRHAVSVCFMCLYLFATTLFLN